MSLSEQTKTFHPEAMPQALPVTEAAVRHINLGFETTGTTPQMSTLSHGDTSPAGFKNGSRAVLFGGFQVRASKKHGTFVTPGSGLHISCRKCVDIVWSTAKSLV